MATQHDSFDHYVNLSQKWTVGGSHVTITDPTPRATGRVFQPDSTPIYHAVDDPGSHLDVHIRCYIGDGENDHVQAVVRNSSGSAIVTIKISANAIRVYLGTAAEPAYTLTGLPVQTWGSVSFLLQPGTGNAYVGVSLNGNTILNVTTATTPSGPITDVGFTGVGSSYIDDFVCYSTFDPVTYTGYRTLLPHKIVCLAIVGDVATTYTQFETPWEPGGNASLINESLPNTATFIQHTLDPVIAPGVGWVSGGESKDIYSANFSLWPDPTLAPHWTCAHIQFCALAQASPYPHQTSMYGIWQTAAAWMGLQQSHIGFFEYPYYAPASWHYLRGIPSNNSNLSLYDSEGNPVVTTAATLDGHVEFGLHARDSVGSTYADISVAHYVIEAAFYGDPDRNITTNNQFLFIC